MVSYHAHKSLMFLCILSLQSSVHGNEWEFSGPERELLFAKTAVSRCFIQAQQVFQDKPGRYCTSALDSSSKLPNWIDLTLIRAFWASVNTVSKCVQHHTILSHRRLPGILRVGLDGLISTCVDFNCCEKHFSIDLKARSSCHNQECRDTSTKGSLFLGKTHWMSWRQQHWHCTWNLLVSRITWWKFLQVL